jgi:hypothetical protein
MNRGHAWAVLLPIALLLFTGPLRAQGTYEDPNGRFVIDLPAGWEYKPILAVFKNNLVSDFQGEGATFSLAFNPGIDDPDKLIKQAAVQFQFLKPEFEGEIKEMSVNGHPARWGILKTPLDPGMTMLVGSVVLGRDGVYLIFTAGARSPLAAFQDKIERSFQSIRLPGEALTGVGDAQAIAPPKMAPTVPTDWKGESVSLTLPPGWLEKPRPRGLEKEVQGWFMYDPVYGANLMVVCYKGLGMNQAKALDAGVRGIKIASPNAQPVEVQEIEVETRKVTWSVFKGTAVTGGVEVEVGFVLAVVKAKHCYVDLLGTIEASHLAEMKSQVLEIVKTVK